AVAVAVAGVHVRAVVGEGAVARVGAEAGVAGAAAPGRRAVATVDVDAEAAEAAAAGAAAAEAAAAPGAGAVGVGTQRAPAGAGAAASLAAERRGLGGARQGHHHNHAVHSKVPPQVRAASRPRWWPTPPGWGRPRSSAFQNNSGGLRSQSDLG